MDEQRVRTVMDNLGQADLTQALICDPLSIWYLTGYYTEPLERFFALLLRKEGREIRSTLFCNALFPNADRGRR